MNNTKTQTDFKGRKLIAPDDLFLFRQISVPVKTWGKYRGIVVHGDVVGYKLGQGCDEEAGEFFIQNAKPGGTELSIPEGEYRRARPATKYDLLRAGL
jgi:hypothetical protein